MEPLELFSLKQDLSVKVKECKLLSICRLASGIDCVGRDPRNCLFLNKLLREKFRIRGHYNAKNWRNRKK